MSFVDIALKRDDVAVPGDVRAKAGLAHAPIVELMAIAVRFRSSIEPFRIGAKIDAMLVSAADGIPCAAGIR